MQRDRPSTSWQRSLATTCEPAAPGRLLLTVVRAAEALNCGRTLVYQLIATGELPVVKLGSLTRVPAESLEDFIKRKTSDIEKTAW